MNELITQFLLVKILDPGLTDDAAWAQVLTSRRYVIAQIRELSDLRELDEFPGTLRGGRV